jgi:hypothetical protein
MPRSLENALVRQELLDRLERLSPDASPHWGRMTAPQMLAHVVDWMLMAKGDLNTVPIKTMPALRYPVFKQLAIYWLPFPRGVQTAPELLGREPLEWTAVRAALRRHLESFETLSSRMTWPEHPVFGKMSRRAWAVFAYRHLDHHFRQFGI